MRVCISRIDCCAVFAWLFSWIYIHIFYIMCILQHSFCLCAWDYAIFSLFRSWHSTDLALLIAPSLLLLVCALWGSKWVSVCVCVIHSMHSGWRETKTKTNRHERWRRQQRATGSICDAMRHGLKSLSKSHLRMMILLVYVGDGEHVRRSWAANRLCLKQISQLR